MATASSLNTLPLHQDHATLYSQTACKRWTVGGVGTTLAVCTLVFVILGCIQPHGFISSVGTIGNPHAWPLWTMAGGGLIVSTLLIAYAAYSKDRVSQPGSAKPFDQATNFNELLGDQLFNQLPKSLGSVSFEGKVDQKWITAPVMSGTLEDGRVCIIFALRCRSSKEEIREKLEQKGIREQVIDPYADTMLEDSVPLFLIRHGCPGRHEDKWVQMSKWTLEGKYWFPYPPSFLCLAERGGGYIPIQADGDQKILEVKGFESLKQLMEGDSRVIVTDHDGFKWGLDNQLIAKKEEGI